MNLKIIFSRNNGPILSKHSTKHAWVMGIQVKGHALFQGAITMKLQNTLTKFKKLGRFQSNLAGSILGWRGFKFGQMKNNIYSILTKEWIFSSSNQWYDINICVDLNWFLRWAMWPMGVLFNSESDHIFPIQALTKFTLQWNNWSLLLY